MSFRWYGTGDPVTLENIRQIPQMKGIVSAIYDIPAGEVWPYDRIVELRDQVATHGMRLNVIESVPVHEDIKMGRGRRGASSVCPASSRGLRHCANYSKRCRA